MKKIWITILLMFLTCGFQGYALEWHENLISYMLSLPIREKQIAVERDEKYLNIKRASYSFSFIRNDVADNIKRILYQHAKEAVKFSTEKGEIILQVVEAPNTYYTYKIGLDPKNPRQHLLLISVSTGKPK